MSKSSQAYNLSIKLWAYWQVPGCPGILSCPLWGLLRCLSGGVSLWQGVPGLMRGCVCVCMCACAPAGLGFVCFPPNWLVFPCPAHQTACFSSHLASPPGLEPPARRRPTRRSREKGRAAHTPGQARSGWVGQGDPSSSSPVQAPPTFLLLPGIQGLWPVPTLSCGIPQCTPVSGLSDASFLPPTGCSFLPSQTGLTAK